MDRKSKARVLFGLALGWALFWGFFASVHRTELHDRVMTSEELALSPWASTGPVMKLWALGPPAGAMLAILSRLLIGDRRPRRLGIFLLSVLLPFGMTMAIGHAGHFRLLYVAFGLILLLLFFAVLWIWGAERIRGVDHSPLAGELQLAGYFFLFTSLWFTCGFVSPRFSLALAGAPLFSDPIIVMIYATLGWSCILGSHWVRARREDSAAEG